jgi:hypothetical protein
MKFLPSLKSAKSLALVAATVVTALVSNIAPSQASKPNRVIVTDGQPQVVIFESDLQSLAIGCMKVRNLWSGIRQTQNVSPQEYQRIINATATRLVGHLNCGAPNLVQGYTSPAFPKAGVIVTHGVPFFVTTTEFFFALGITPTKLNAVEGQKFIQQRLQLFTNVTLDTRR